MTALDLNALHTRSLDIAPEWLLQQQVGLCPCGCIGKRKKGSFVARTINGGATLMRQAMFSGDVALLRGLLQKIEPRVKLLTMLGLLLTTAFIRNIPVLVGLYGVTLVLAVVSGLPLGFFIKRVWLFIPIFTGVVVLPATFSFITHGDIVVPLGTWFGDRVGLTHQGLSAAGLIVIRVAVSISLVVLLTLTTPWNRLLASLRAIFVPRIFILVLGMAYRYIFLLLTSVTDMYVARTARTVEVDTDVASGRKFVAASAGALFGKSHALADEVHMAMLSRGYTGHVRSLSQSRPAMRDATWSVGCVAIGVAALLIDHAIGR
ncbi:MAG: cobalt ECF transporter T component CbiQ [Ilumatobacteraceae bacterium]